MSDFLASMVVASEARAARLPANFPAEQLDKPVFPLRLSGFDIIAEIKAASPSAGRIAAATFSRNELAAEYVRGGAAAISVLTEPSRFAGDIGHLAAVSELAARDGVPVMRKDFLVSTAQVLEAKVCGASGVLLIVAMLSDGRLEDMLRCASEHGLFVLLESFDEDDLERTRRLLGEPAHQAQATDGKLLVGVNTRNLRTLEVDGDRLGKLGASLPEGVVCVAESGLSSPADAAAAVDSGYQAALIGTALMRSDNPATLLQDMLRAGRSRVDA
jgi:indole-3-glycerol phosphate synthase